LEISPAYASFQSLVHGVAGVRLELGRSKFWDMEGLSMGDGDLRMVIKSKRFRYTGFI